MCGIVGAISKNSVTSRLVEGLQKLEYRGYDSAGVAVLNDEQEILRHRVRGKVKELEICIEENPIAGQIGIAHTRWATHGEPSVPNAHPHVSNDQIILVHNGIIENHETLLERLKRDGYKIISGTDSELAAHLIFDYIKSGKTFLQAVQAAVAEFEGAYALGIMNTQNPNELIAVCQGAPLVIGIGDHEHFFASDTIALGHHISKFMYLERGDIAEVSLEKVRIFNRAGQEVKREVHTVNVLQESIEKGEYPHFMLKEIYHQPDAIAETFAGCIGKNKILQRAFGEKAEAIFKNVAQVQIIACGTSYHAGLVAKYWIEEIANIPCFVDIASEYRYRHNVVLPNTLFVCISQSGETADTLSSLRKAKEMGYLAVLSICNVPFSTIVRESDLTFFTRAGVELGVASTKAFTTQLTALLMLSIALVRDGKMPEEIPDVLRQLQDLPNIMHAVLKLDERIQSLAKQFVDKQHALFLGRGLSYPIALEGALKLKEISYIHAEGYPAGELKHGPLALVDSEMPVIAVAPNDELLEKLKSNLQEVRARGGKLFVFADETIRFQANEMTTIIKLPAIHRWLSPILYTLPLQLLSYHVAVLRGTDVDQPRNLAKSVTVE